MGPGVKYLVACHLQRLTVILAHVWLCLTYLSHKIGAALKTAGLAIRKTVNHFNLNTIYWITVEPPPPLTSSLFNGHLWIISLSGAVEPVATSLTR